MEKIFYCAFNTKCGWIGIAANDYGLIAMVLPQTEKGKVLSLIKKRVFKKDLVMDEEYFKEIKNSLIAYCEGKKVTFNYLLDLRFATNFEKNVFKATQSIPYGEARSYQFIAKEVGSPKAFRSVGQALKKNPLPIIIPCHRVIQSNGKLGGFLGGIELKEKLLRIEGYKCM
ncbi:MAG: methylated-DNA--[protein]-cysteine S-methyltransferase [bacterium]